STRTTVRNTQLYRTLPHEVGHYVQYHQDVESRAGDDLDEWGRLNDAYFSRPQREREDFAHRYADNFRERHGSWRNSVRSSTPGALGAPRLGPHMAWSWPRRSMMTGTTLLLRGAGRR
ncbi:MAG: hypothetical protein OXU20_38555, partial [Myxococcales bacterium]|nr:hypothetical protein [Myxococcales bacterium]